MKNRLYVLKQTKYEDNPISIFRFGSMIQYIFTYNGEMYQDHVFLKLDGLRKLFAFFGYKKYSDEEVEYARDVVLSSAIKSIDALKEVKSS